MRVLRLLCSAFAFCLSLFFVVGSLSTKSVMAQDAPNGVPLPYPSAYCSNSTPSNNLSNPPTPFLYRPFESSAPLGEVWTSQMDHDKPVYVKEGKLASLGEVVSGPITQEPSGYWSPSLELDFYYDGHDGNDFGVLGHALAAAPGRVVFAGHYSNSLGRVVEILHPAGYVTRYAHLASITVHEGDEIATPGQPIGTIGGSGFANGQLVDNRWGIHLHFSVFRWDATAHQWKITDPFGWDPWLSPGQQDGDPLKACNGEVSFNLWRGGFPTAYGASAAALERPTHGRYMGGWLGGEPFIPVSLDPDVAATNLSATVTANTLNVRSGPGTGFARLASVSRNQTLAVSGRNSACSWIKVALPTGVSGWVAAQFVTLNGTCSSAPVDAGTASPSSPAVTAPPAAATTSNNMKPGLVTDFETWGSWQRGDESWGTFAQSSEQVHGGAFSGKLAYSFPAAANNYVVYQRSLVIPGNPSALNMWVYGDSSGSFVNAWVRDASASVWQFTFGRVDFSGWRQMSAPLDTARGWPNSLISGSGAAGLASPLQFVALVVDGAPDDRAIQGTIYFDDLAVGDAVVASSPAPKPAAPAAPPTAVPAAPPTAVPPPPTPVPTRAAASAQISFRADPETVAYAGCSTLRWDVENVKAVFLSQRGSNNEAGVTGHGTQVICAGATSTFDLRVVHQDGSQVIYTVVVTVEQGAPPAAVAPTVEPPPVANPSFSIWADATSLQQGECTTVRWETSQISALYFGVFGYDMRPVVGVGSEWVCPGSTTIYGLRVILQSGSEEYPTVTVAVEASTPTQPIAAPQLTQPGNNARFVWGTRFDFGWASVSGATEYLLEYVYLPTGETFTSGWIPATQWRFRYKGPGNYDWRVKARTGAGETPWSETWRFVQDAGIPWGCVGPGSCPTPEPPPAIDP